MTRTSIVVPTRGGAARLPRLLEALVRQSHQDIETIVVVDGDVDGTAGVAARWTDRLDLKVIVLPENRGRSVALNTGFEIAHGDVLIRCDDDLEPGADWAATHARLHEGAPTGVIGLYLNRYPANAYTRSYAVPRDDRFRREAYRAPGDTTWRYWAGNVSTTREVWRQVGPYDTAYRAYGFEDVDWGYRLHRLGLPVVLAPELEVVHHSPATSTRVRASRAFHSGAARRTFERLHGREALGPVDLAPTGVWGRATVRVGGRLGRRGVEGLGRVADGLAPLLPRYAAEKAIAFAVESAAHAGHAQPDDLDLDI